MTGKGPVRRRVLAVHSPDCRGTSACAACGATCRSWMQRCVVVGFVSSLPSGPCSHISAAQAHCCTLSVILGQMGWCHSFHWQTQAMLSLWFSAGQFSQVCVVSMYLFVCSVLSIHLGNCRTISYSFTYRANIQQPIHPTVDVPFNKSAPSTEWVIWVQVYLVCAQGNDQRMHIAFHD